MKLLTILIVAYTMEKCVERALDSLIDEKIIKWFRNIYIDGNSMDPTLKIVEKYPDSIFPLHKKWRMGFNSKL